MGAQDRRRWEADLCSDYFEAHPEVKYRIRGIISSIRPLVGRAPTFRSEQGVIVAAWVEKGEREKFRLMADYRGLSVSSMARETLHTLDLKRIRPLPKPQSLLLSSDMQQIRLSPCEAERLDRYAQMWDVSRSTAIRTLIRCSWAPSKPLSTAPRPYASWVALVNLSDLDAYRDTARRFGYTPAELMRQLLAFQDGEISNPRVAGYLRWILKRER